MASSTESSEVYCECGSLDCVERVEVPSDVYERVRGDGALFLVKAGHEAGGDERVAAIGGTYRVLALGPASDDVQIRVPLAPARAELVPDAS